MTSMMSICECLPAIMDGKQCHIVNHPACASCMAHGLAATFVIFTNGYIHILPKAWCTIYSITCVRQLEQWPA